MCILIVKPAGVAMPSEKTLRNCFDSNRDGAGFAYSDGRKLRLLKGYMSFKKFAEALEEQGDLTKFAVMLHFRIATHGTVKPENTHPFNVNDRIVAGHNGILKMTPKDDMTDSETFFKHVCAPMLKHTNIHDKDFQDMVSTCIDSSKVAFLTDTGEFVLFGSFIEAEGVYYSNSTYKGWGDYYSGLGGRGIYDYEDYLYNDSYDRYDRSGVGYKTNKSVVQNPYKEEKKNGEVNGLGKKITPVAKGKDATGGVSVEGITIGSDKHWEIVYFFEDCVEAYGYSRSQAIGVTAGYWKISETTVTKLVSSFYTEQSHLLGS